jgi:hypothetical protein
MRGRATPAALALGLMAMTSLGCSEEQTVPEATPTESSQTPSPSLPTDTSLLRYVSPTGDDTGPGTIDRPWRTLAWAFHRVYEQQVLFVRDGTYREAVHHVGLHDGTPDKPITVLAYPGENPVLAGTVSLNRPRHWLIDNLDVTGDPSASGEQPRFMVKIVGGHSWTWQNSEFSDTVGSANVMITGWGMDEPWGFRFTGNCLHGLPEPPASATNLFLGAMGPGTHGILARNVVFNADDQPNVRIGSGAGTPTRVKLLRNTIYGGSLGIDVRGRPHRVKIAQSIVGGSHQAPAMVRFSGGRTDGTTMTNNVAVNAAQLLRPEVSKSVHGYGNLEVPGDPEFVDTTRCDGFRSTRDALIPYGAFAP